MIYVPEIFEHMFNGLVMTFCWFVRILDNLYDGKKDNRLTPYSSKKELNDSLALFKLHGNIQRYLVGNLSGTDDLI